MHQRCVDKWREDTCGAQKDRCPQCNDTYVIESEWWFVVRTLPIRFVVMHMINVCIGMLFMVSCGSADAAFSSWTDFLIVVPMTLYIMPGVLLLYAVCYVWMCLSRTLCLVVIEFSIILMAYLIIGVYKLDQKVYKTPMLPRVLPKPAYITPLVKKV